MGLAVIACLGVDSLWATARYWASAGAAGWSDLLQYMADGRDGGSRTVRRGNVLCLVDFRQDGGDDSEPAYIPGPAVAEVTTCRPGKR